MFFLPRYSPHGQSMGPVPMLYRNGSVFSEKEKLFVQSTTLALLFLVCSFALTPRGTQAQSSPPISEQNDLEAPDDGSLSSDWKFTRGAWEFGVEAGYSPWQPTFFSGRKEYDTEGRQFGLMAFSVGRIIGTKGPVTYKYYFEAIPTLAVRNEVRNPNFISDTETPSEPATIRKNTVAFAAMPVGFKFIFRPKKRLKPFISTATGFIFSQKPIPVPESTTYNFAGSFGGGLSYSLKKRTSLNVGYRYFHISNMNIGQINPGYNANIFYIGVSFRTK